MNIVLALLVFQSAFLEAKICQIKQLVSKPVRQSYLENVRQTVSYPCCTNIACDPPVCKKVYAITVKCVQVCLNDEYPLICLDIICYILIKLLSTITTHHSIKPRREWEHGGYKKLNFDAKCERFLLTLNKMRCPSFLVLRTRVSLDTRVSAACCTSLLSHSPFYT